MSRYFTSDLHLGSTLINKYAHRPFTSASDALDKLTKTINSTLLPTDSLIHVGDFMLDGKDQHGKEVDVGLDFTRDQYLQMIKSRVTLLAGNHDDGHNCEADAKYMVIDLNQNYKNVLVAHYPSTHNMFKYSAKFGPKHAGDKVPYIQLCGHVHDAWLVKYDVGNNVLNINIGPDVWDYKPVRDSEITKLLDYIFKESYYQPFLYGLNRTWYVSRLTLNGIIAYDQQLRKRDAENRKKERYARKGLTPEECERRKQEAMAKKKAK